MTNTDDVLSFVKCGGELGHLGELGRMVEIWDLTLKNGLRT